MTKEHFIDNPEYIALTTDIADLMLQKRVGLNYKRFITEDEEGNQTYTIRGQELFEEYLQEVEAMFALNSVSPMDLNIEDSGLSFTPDLELVEKIKPEAKILPFKGKIGAISGEKKDE
jgi:hypothetical protein|tara:strand:- start:106 stop:459 length:354 start_codon:yes stop_codon:yes gene_type:complete